MGNEEEEENTSKRENVKVKAEKKKMKNSNRRFSEEQIKLLEAIFEAETTIEPRRKLQVAAELGLQPRQVAIWFQNKRARWKSKRIEMDYNALRHDYDDLVARFEGLKKERQSLVLQLKKLNDLVEKPSRERNSPAEEDETRIIFRNEKTSEKEEEAKTNGFEEAMEPKFEEEVKMERRTEEALDLDSEKLFDDHQPCSSISRWLDFWG